MKRFSMAIILAVGCFCLFHNAPLMAQQGRYTVQKGDTLWDICEQIYGDADLWPKLWQMNPFITNPHLLKPGDTIRLLEEFPPQETKKEEAPPAVAATPFQETGLDVSFLTNVKTMGYLAREAPPLWGRILSGEKERMMLSAGDVAYVEMEEGFLSDPGKVYTVYNLSPPLKDPLDGRDLGIVLTFLGRVSVMDHVKDRLYKGVVVESYRTINPGDLLIPEEPVSPCVRLVPGDPELYTHIAAVKDQLTLIGQFGVVYLPVGYVDGIKKGNLFEILDKREARPVYPSHRKRVALPERVLGHLLVLESRPDSSTAVVVAVKENIAKGTIVKGLNWIQVPDFFSELQNCVLE